MSDPKLADALNPRYALNRRLAAESQAIPALPDLPAKFTKPFTPAERERQRLLLIEALRQRDTSTGGQ